MPQDLKTPEFVDDKSSVKIEDLPEAAVRTILTEMFEEDDDDSEYEYEVEPELEWDEETEYGIISTDELLDLKALNNPQKSLPTPVKNSLFSKQQLIQLLLVLFVSILGATLSNYIFNSEQALNATKTTPDSNQSPFVAIRKDILQLKSQASLYEHSTNDIKTQLTQVRQKTHDIDSEIDTLKNRVNNLELFAKEHGIFNLLNESLPESVLVDFDSETGNVTSILELWQIIASELEANHGSKEIKETILSYFNTYFKRFTHRKQVSPKAQIPVYVSKSVFFKQIIEKELESLKFDIKKEVASLNTAIGSELPGLVSNTAEGNKTLLLVNALIKNAIQRYVTHTISKPDFVDLGSGAKIIPELTSSSYDWKHALPELERKFRQFLGRFGFGRMKVNRPQVAFTGSSGSGSSVSLGGCWPINGRSGQVGVDLGKTVRPSDIGVLHIKAEQTPNPKTAPRHISLYVEINDEKTREDLRATLLAEEQQHMTEKEDTLTNDVRVPETFVKISTIEYDLFKEEFQVFEIVKHGFDIQTSRVVFTIDDNWGDDDLTCVYRLRLFGEPIGEQD
ncbi:hypothetical protein D0Z00_002161 [Geotrichum galactomycetum]|uniref:Uncharacterized protein n=1 Tax=Geotrichum galactomycetum TaxID=27317 RepID=A0ACB6V4Z8_9ASCO|nr:hypothetical protein D0Z00_002161 [Geotrichum candidum]